MRLSSMFCGLLRGSFLLIVMCASISTALAGGAIVALDESESIDVYLCTGDLVGYGAFPRECIDRVRERCPNRVVAGNHDFAVLYEPARFNLSAEQAIFWTRSSVISGTSINLVQGQASAGPNWVMKCFIPASPPTIR